jgi:hypothetical protein
MMKQAIFGMYSIEKLGYETEGYRVTLLCSTKWLMIKIPSINERTDIMYGLC